MHDAYKDGYAAAVRCMAEQHEDSVERVRRTERLAAVAEAHAAIRSDIRTLREVAELIGPEYETFLKGIALSITMKMEARHG